MSDSRQPSRQDTAQGFWQIHSRLLTRRSDRPDDRRGYQPSPPQQFPAHNYDIYLELYSIETNKKRGLQWLVALTVVEHLPTQFSNPTRIASQRHRLPRQTRSFQAS